MNSPAALQLEGPRIFLRPVTPKDASGPYHRWLNDPEITMHLESRFITHTVEAIRSYIESIVANPLNVFLAICLKENGGHIGNIKLGPVSQPHRTGDIGLIIGERECWGQGYATEAIIQIADHAFGTMGLHKLTAGCYSTNLGSARAFEKASFHIEGRRVSHYWQLGRYVDCILLARHNPAELL
jgi:[ribosomal protein S5]-alanine N-acetyltransferase